jgi:hypothetical protein
MLATTQVIIHIIAVEQSPILHLQQKFLPQGKVKLLTEPNQYLIQNMLAAIYNIKMHACNLLYTQKPAN